MANKKFVGFNMILVAVALTISLVAFSSMRSSLAWFSENKEVSAFGLTVSADAGPQITATLTSHGVLDILEENTVYVMEAKDGEGKRPEMHELPVVDPNNISYSQYAKALVIVIDLVASEDVKIDVWLNTPHAIVTIAEESYLSNCIQVREATYNDAGNTATVDSLTSQTFVSISNNTYTKVTSLLLSNSVSLQKDVPTTLCYVIEYNNEFIDYVNQYVLENALTIMKIDYQGDITFAVSESES